MERREEIRKEGVKRKGKKNRERRGLERATGWCRSESGRMELKKSLIFHC